MRSFTERHHRQHLLSSALVAVAAAALWTLAVFQPAVRAQASTSVCDLRTDDRVVAVGDVHGAYDQFVAILKEAGLIDGRRRWIGGHATLVQLGDLLDRGDESRQVLDLLGKLTDDAPKAGGSVHVLLGNHEVMRMMGDYRYVSPKEYEAFRSPSADTYRDKYYSMASEDALQRAKAAGQPFDDGAFRKKFFEDTPLGYVEMQLAFADTGDYGKWLRERDVMVRINDVVFVHGGPAASIAAMGCAGINAKAHAELATMAPGTTPAEAPLLAASNGPVWYRGLTDDAEPATPEEVSAALDALHARVVVVGHSVVSTHAITVSHEGRVVQIDTGMLGGTFFPDGVPSALEIKGDTWTAIYEGGRREPLKVGAPQG